MDDFFQQASQRPGLRLHKLELFNWGTFDSSAGRVFTVHPRGKTSLLVGQNGAGKSTLADALLTLLVRSSTRNYNVAAGAGRVGQARNRTERTYIRGAFDHGGDGEGTALQLLRKGGGVYSVILASFLNEDIEDAAFTLAQILYLTGDEKAEKVFAFAPGEKSIAGDLAGFTSFERLRKQVEDRGFQATTTFSQYERWFFKAAGLRPKAMEVFNQTVAVKDIESLNTFIRRHMLEKRNWKEDITRVLSHFTQLSEAHRALLQAREQLKLLGPVKRAHEGFEAASGELQRLEAVKAALHPWFCRKRIDLLEPLIVKKRQELASQTERQGELDRQIAAHEETIRQLANEIERAGGPRLQQLPGLIEAAEGRAAEKRARAAEFTRHTGECGIDSEMKPGGPGDEAEFKSIRTRLHERAAVLRELIPKTERKKAGLGYQRHELARSLSDIRSEIEALKQRRTALPERFAALRRQVCEALHLPENELPFVAELVAVKSDERDWECSIEMVLRGFALSLLVPERFYRQVSDFVDRTRLANRDGDGQRLVYFRIGENILAGDEPDEGTLDLDPDTLPGKLDYRPKHKLTPWVRGEIRRRFSYACCSSIEEFQRHGGDAMTTHRHVKSGRGRRHEKDDRRRSTDHGRFVLGWDNRRKLRFLAELAGKEEQRQITLDDEISRLDGSLKLLRSQEQSAARALETLAFHAIDHRAEEEQVADLRREEHALRTETVQLRDLNQRLNEARAAKDAARDDRDACLRSTTTLEGDLRTSSRVLREARGDLDAWDAAGTLAEHEASFPAVESLGTDLDFSNPLAIDKPERTLAAQLDREVGTARQKVEPLQTRLLDAMASFLKRFEAQRGDLHPGVEYAGAFVEMHDQLVKEDLPGFEQRFKDRLNDKAAKEIAVLHGKFQEESHEIKSSIALLNDALRTLPYRPATHMQLLPQDVRDPEIHRFRGQLRDCLADAFEGSMDAHEARFQRIERLITDLRDDDRYRDRVTDVRRWFDFFACEIVTETGAEQSRYSDSSGRSGGEKAKLAFTILVAAIAYQYQIDPRDSVSDRFHFVVVDEMFSKIDDDHARYALDLFHKLGLQLLIVAPLDAKARVTEEHVDYYLLVTKDETTNHSEIFTMSAEKFKQLSNEGDAR